MTAGQDTSNASKQISLPPGWVPGVGSKGGRTFIVTCQHGTRSLDRIPGVRQYLSRHAECNAAWEPHLQRPSETDAEHAERLKETFCFLKNFTSFANFPAPLPYSPSKGGSGKQEESPGPGSKRKPPASAAAQPAKRKRQSQALVRPSDGNKPASAVAQPAERKRQSPAHLRPSDGAKAASAAKPARQVSQKRPAAVQQDPVLKWAKQLEQAAAPKAAAPKQRSSAPSWDSLTADDIRGQLQGAAEEFEGKKAGFSMSLEIDATSAISAEAMLGREVRILWQEDNAWFPGTISGYDSSSGQHTVLYADGDSESIFLPMERMRLTVRAGETLDAPTPDELTATAQHLLSAADATDNEAKSGDQSQGDALRERAAQLLQLAEDRGQAMADRDLRKPQLIGQPALADSAAPHSEQRDDIPGAGCAAAAEAAAAKQQQEAAGQHSSSTQSYAGPGLGSIVWGREKGWPHWPALLITKETSRGLCNLRTVKNGSALWFFGTFEMACLRPAESVTFEEGLHKGLHATCKRSVKLFRAALQQVHRYLKTGKLPDQMVLDNNDEVWYDEAEEIDEAVDLHGTAFPLRLGKNLQVLKLGRIEWMRPTYHTKKHIYPVGYTAVRAVELSATRGSSVQCLCEIGQSADSFEPVFRVTPENGPAEEASNPTKAWRALLERHGLAKRAAGLSGLRMFGLDTPTVAKLIQSLPHAARCSSFEAWAGEKPEPVPLTAEEEAQQLSLAASCQQLPEGIHAIAAHEGSQGACSVCGEEEETNFNHLLQCDGCRGFVHMACYGVPSPPEGRLWLCDLCKLGPERQPACALCPVSGGLMRRTTCGQWVHATCALWTPGTWINCDTGLVEGLSKLSKARFQLSCSLCNQTYGACIQCAGSRQCFAAFHPTCAAKAGLRMVAVDDGEGSDSDSDSDTDKRATQAEPDGAAPSEHLAGASKPGQEPKLNRVAQDMQLSEVDLGTTTAEPELAQHEGLPDSSAGLVQLDEDTPAADPAQREQAAGQSAENADRTASQKPQILLPVISVSADCTEEGSPRDPLAVIQIPQQHAEGIPGCIQMLNGLPPVEKHLAVDKPAAQKSAGNTEQPEAAYSAQLHLSDVVQQVACSSPSEIATDAGMFHASSAQHAADSLPAPGDACSTGDAAESPKRERRPSTKAAEAPALPPECPGSPGTLAQHAPALRRRPSRPRRAWKEGTYIGNGMWLMCYCSRHRRALEEMGATRAVVSMTTGQGLQDALSPQPKARQASGRTQAVPPPKPSLAAGTERCPDERMNSSRESAYNQELRRHQRAPDALAAALTKRAFVRKTPYLVTTASLPRPAGQLAASCGPPFAPLSDVFGAEQDSAALPRAAALQKAAAAASRQSSDMPASAASLELACSGQDTVIPFLALSPQQAGPGQEAGCSADAALPKHSSRLKEKRLSGRLTSYQQAVDYPGTETAQHAQGRRVPAAVTQQCSVGSRAGKLAGEQGEDSAANKALPCIRSHELSRLTLQFPETCTAGIACISVEKEQPAAAQQPVQSLAERYADMKRTVMERLTCGKSAIHGWGAFTKRAHAEGDMLIEYAGELVRRSVADTRERRCYDKLVGAGTYVFGLNEDVCVDATRAGNMAHLLNHSCEPNAYSRTITVRCMETGTLSDHVVIFARRSIQPGEELTYDYRFCGIEKLPCNCGAPSCRGFVNAAKPGVDSHAQLVLRSRLKPYTGQKLIWDGE